MNYEFTLYLDEPYFAEDMQSKVVSLLRQVADRIENGDGSPHLGIPHGSLGIGWGHPITDVSGHMRIGTTCIRTNVEQ